MRVKLNSILILILMILLMLVTFSPPLGRAEVYPREETLYIDLVCKIPTPDVFNPYLIGETWNGITQCLAEFLAYVNLENGTVMPWLATKWEMSPDYMKLTIHLRKGVKWSDGVPLTAKDLVFTINMLKKYAPKLILSSEVDKWIKSARAIDDYTVECELTAPDPRIFLRLFAVRIHYALYVVPEHIWKDVDPTKFKNYPPIFSGPYKLVSSSEDTFIYERRDDWWATEELGIRPAPKYVIFKYWGEEEKRVMVCSRHEGDAIHDITTSSWLKLKEINPEAIVWHVGPPYAWLDPCPRYLGLNNLKYPWSIREVRWALSYLINRDEIVRVAYENSSIPSPTLLPQYKPIVDPYLKAISDLLEKYNTTEYNPEKAYAIFKELGFKRGPDGIWVTPNGTRLEMTLLVTLPFIELMRIATVLTEQLKAGGIDVTMKPLELGPWAEALVTGAYDGIVKWCCGSVVDPYFTLDNFHSKWFRPIGESVSTWYTNTERYKNPEYDAVLDKLATTPKEDPKSVELFRKAMEIWLHDLPAIPITQAKKLVPFDTHYWIGWPTADNPWIQPPHWWGSTLFIILNIRPKHIDYTVAYFTKDMPAFRGIDLTWYGPFKVGDAARIPVADAEFLIKRGYASYTPPSLPTVIPPEIPAIATTVKKLSDDVSDLKTNVAKVSENLSILRGEVEALRGQMSMLITVAIIEGLAIVALAITLAFIMRKKPA